VRQLRIILIEIKSQSEIVKPLEKKIKNFIELGAQVGILIDPDEETVTVIVRKVSVWYWEIKIF
jgi:Uma2 family endonuclease